MVVLDVLRWSTVVVTALANGAPWVEACATPDEARERAEALGRDRVILGGERENVALPGFDLGNSPLEYTAARLASRGVVTTTTNGTQAMRAARFADEILVGAFVNLDAVARRCAASLRAGRPLTLVGAGQAGHAIHEDTAGVGALAEATLALCGDLDPDRVAPDATTRDALARWRELGRDPARAVGESPHATALRAAGFGADLELAARRALHVVVPHARPTAQPAARRGASPQAAEPVIRLVADRAD